MLICFLLNSLFYLKLSIFFKVILTIEGLYDLIFLFSLFNKKAKNTKKNILKTMEELAKLELEKEINDCLKNLDFEKHKEINKILFLFLI